MVGIERAAPTRPRPWGTRGAGERPLAAIGLVLIAVTVFSSMDAISKVLAADYHPIEITWARYFFIVLSLVPWVARPRQRLLRTARPGLQVLRGLCIVGSSLFFVYGLVTLPMAQAIAISFISPLLVTGLSITLLGEHVGIRRWLAVAAGFLGVLIVVRPGGAGFDPAVGFPILSALCWATGLITIRSMGASDPPLTTVFYSTAVGLAVMSVILLPVWIWPTPEAWILMAVMGLLGAFGHYLLVLAYMRASPAVLAPFSYFQMLTSSLAGYAVFGAVPDLGTWSGGAVIVGSGLYTLHREHIRRGRPTIPSGAG
jgi:drug/metabolite transporter (DMT)-like permease